MKKIRYLCIDDKPDEVKLALKQVASANTQLEIDLSRPTDFREQIKATQELCGKGRLDGLLIDLRLDQSAAKGQRPVEYNAPLFASQMRSLMSQGEVEEFPIVLWSITSKLASSYDQDVTSHDLFDLVLDKDQLDEYVPSAAQQLVSFAAAYHTISSQPRDSSFWTKILRVPKDIDLDPRVGEEFEQNLRKVPVHAIVRYVFEEIAQKPGPLIDEDLLSSRMGVERVSLFRSKLANKLDAVARYKGSFSDAWPRWWWSAIEQWWKSVDPDIPQILSMTAAERVTALKEIFGYEGLRAAKVIAAGNSSRFTVICQGLKRPLDPIDGFMLSATGLKPWQDRLYVCEEVARRPSKYHLEKPLDSLEAERLKAIPKKQPTAKQ
jgi:hypothetical protein